MTRKIWKSGFIWLAVAVLGLPGGHEQAAGEDSPEPPLRGVVVEEVAEGSALARAGLQAGDLVLGWERLPAPPANPEGKQGEIASP
ncbi:MAG: hypothetical protein GY842_13140, partial [bacterium]|nr:hypothetical protein [bacterium]